MLFSQWALLLTVWMLRPPQVSAFNLDTQNVIKKRGEANTLFGFSMAMHHQLKPSEERVLLIGAPRAKALPSQNANISGGLYRCKFTTESDDCERIPVDIKERPINIPGQDYRENQWLGVRVRSQGRGGKVVTCAHRYQDWSFQNRRLLGRCFVLEQDLKLLTDGAATRTICRNRDPEKHKFGYCQQGVSVAFSKDNKYLVYGAPGAYDWKGFAVDTGMNLMKKGELNVVAGAPLSNHSGEVLLLRPEEKAETRDLKAEWDDLIVGAPEFSKENMDEDVGGAVYVYINQAKGQNWNQIKPVCLYGKRDSMFGLAVAHIGDINQDGYQVSAPNEDSGRGRVYIYHGSAAGFRQKPEVLDAGDPGIKSFGYSLAGNMDIDDNGYPDLVVGSLSDTVQVYRTKPVVNIEKTLTLSPNTIDFKAQDCKTSSCILTAQSCFTYTAQLPTYNHKLRIKYTLKADTVRTERGLSSRVVFMNPEDAQGYQELSVQGKQECFQTALVLLGDIQDKLTTIFISLSVSLPSNNPKQRVRNLPGLEPVLNPLQENATKAQVTFLNAGCGNDNICQSNLQLQYSFCTKDQEEDKCDPLAMENDIPVISPGDKNVALEVTVTNTGGDDAHQSQLSVTFPEFLQLSSVEPKKSSETQVQCNPNEYKTQANCQLGNPFKRDSEVSFFLILNTERLSLRVTSANIINVGRPLKSFGSVVLHIQWPKATKEGKWLLYLMQIKDHRKKYYSLHASRGHQPTQIYQGRREVERESGLKALASTTDFFPFLGNKRKYKTLTCADDLRCVEIKCPLEAVDSTTAVEYNSLNYLDIVLDAFLTLNGTLANIGMQPSDTKVKLTVFRESKPALLSRVPWWVIMFSILTALLFGCLNCGVCAKEKKV
ncbi:Integrin alpha-6 [Labeo rohita]|uniref:Integrin alpha-6 n=1 Tax=Labeo rohita TaxID=84645 RepID=A0ABQ8M228_LABRO|nr:Integrin alpha-6 [Labeo rohita]